MGWLARLFLLVPALITGWFVSREDPRFWVVALVIGLMFLFLLCVAGLYAQRLSIGRSKRSR